jgi:hypothetical protein
MKVMEYILLRMWRDGWARSEVYPSVRDSC